MLKLRAFEEKDFSRVICWMHPMMDVLKPYQVLMGEGDAYKQTRNLVQSFTQSVKPDIKDKNNFSIVLYLALVLPPNTHDTNYQGVVGITEIRLRRVDGQDSVITSTDVEDDVRDEGYESYYNSDNFKNYAYEKAIEALNL